MNPVQTHPNQTQPAHPPVPEPSAGAFKADIVSAIPLRVPGGEHVPALNEDDELEKIMRDVGSDLKKDDTKPRKKGWLDFKRQPKTPKPKPPAPRHQADAQPAAPPKAAPKKLPRQPRNLPVYIITMTISVTTALIVAAILAYK